MISIAKNYVCRVKAIAKPFTFRCEIDHFPFRLTKVDAQFESPVFEVADGVPMRVGLKRSKDEECKASSGGTEVLSAYFRNVSEHKEILVDYSITLINARQPWKSIKRKATKPILFGKCAENWGWENFISFADLLNKNEGFLEGGHQLTLVVEGTAFVEEIQCEEIANKDNEEIRPENFYKYLQANFYKAFGSPSDFTLKVTDFNGTEREFKVHRSILAAGSKVFEEIFSNPELKECREGVLEVEDIDSGAMESLLRFLYTGKFPSHLSETLDGNDGKNIHDMLDLMRAADKYQVLVLKNHLFRVGGKPLVSAWNTFAKTRREQMKRFKF